MIKCERLVIEARSQGASIRKVSLPKGFSSQKMHLKKIKNEELKSYKICHCDLLLSQFIFRTYDLRPNIWQTITVLTKCHFMSIFVLNVHLCVKDVQTYFSSIVYPHMVKNLHSEYFVVETTASVYISYVEHLTLHLAPEGGG